MPTSRDSFRAELQDALWRLDVAERALRDARTQLASLADAPPAQREPQRQPQPQPQVQRMAQPLAGGPARGPAQPEASPYRAREAASPAVATPAGARPATALVAPAPAQQRPQPDRESTLIRAVAIIGAIVTVVGVGFLVTVAIQAGLLGPAGRVILAYVVALGLGAAAFRFRSSAPPAATTALLATSLYTALATTYLTATWLRWWPVWFAAIAMTALYLAYAWVAQQWRNASIAPSTQLWLAIGAWVASMSYPLDKGSDPTTMSILMLAAAVVAVTVLWDFPHRDEVRGVSGIVVALCVRELQMIYAFRWALLLAIIAGSATVALVAVTLYAPTRTRRTTNAYVKSYGHLIAGGIAPLVMLLGFVDADYGVHDIPALRMWLLVAAVGASLALAWNHREGKILQELMLFVLPLLVAVAVRTTTEDYPYLVLGLALTLGYFAVFFFLVPRLRVVSTAAWAGGSIMLSAELFVGTLWAPERLLSASRAGVAVILGVFVAAVYFARRRPQGMQRIFAGALVLFGLVLSMLAVVGTLTYLGGLALGDEGYRTVYYAAHALVSISWMVLAARILLAHRNLTGLGVLLSVVAIAKLVFFDMAATAGFFRALAFLVSGVVLLTIAVRRSQTPDQSESRGPQGAHVESGNPSVGM